MLIREVEERCGISKKNIHFYEQQGLLQPITANMRKQILLC